MKKSNWKAVILILFVLLVVFIGSFVYNFYDNHRFIVVEDEITLDRLPQSFDNFKILQISDLHGRSFGENQANLIHAINSLEYDMIAFTGDMDTSTGMDNPVHHSQAILDLIDGIENREYLFWIDGNTGPHAIESYSGAYTGELTDIGKVLQEKGCKVMTLPYAITRGNDRIWVTSEMSEIGFDGSYRSGAEESYGGKDTYDRIQLFYQEAYESFKEIHGNAELKIMLNHYPKQTNLSAEELKLYGANLDYDLILAGHYHGGQWRLPVIGALYIPSATTGIHHSGYFPSQKGVKGWSYFGTVPQFVSAGLGASNHIGWANFRLFNTPEINLITLKQRSIP